MKGGDHIFQHKNKYIINYNLDYLHVFEIYHLSRWRCTHLRGNGLSPLLNPNQGSSLILAPCMWIWECACCSLMRVSLSHLVCFQICINFVLKVLDLIVFKIWVSYIIFAAKSVGVCCLWIPIELVFEWLFEIAPKDEVSGG